MKKIDKKLNSFFKKIEKTNPEQMLRPLVGVLLFTIFTIFTYSYFISFEANRIKIGQRDVAHNHALEKKLKKMVKGYPIEKMVSQIVKKDEVLAAYLVGIAKKESNWGKRVPVLDGKDCYNYWGYRGVRDKMGSGGHTCFNSPSDAVNTISKRLSYFIDKKGLEKPEELIVWKCGSSCEGHSKESVNKWINDVGYYYEKVVE